MTNSYPRRTPAAKKEYVRISTRKLHRPPTGGPPIRIKPSSSSIQRARLERELKTAQEALNAKK
ncbi:MAG: hypothetical protein AAGL08_12120, partial [Cyanobacteria bacterium J06573_11]